MTFELEQIFSGLAAIIVGVVSYLLKHYLSSFRRDVAALEKELAAVMGHIQSLQTDIRTNTVELTRTTTELKALWRWVDAQPRASDINGGKLHERD